MLWWVARGGVRVVVALLLWWSAAVLVVWRVARAAARGAVVVVGGHCDGDEVRCKLRAVVVCLRCKRDAWVWFVVRDIDFLSFLMIHTIVLECLDVVCKEEES